MSNTAKLGRVMMGALFVAALTLVCFSPSVAQWEDRGDLNLNGLPFELADLAIYADYFASGIPCFFIEPERQIAATDINMDGLTLTVADYVMMVRLEMGEGDPPPSSADTFPSTVVYGFTDSSLIVSAIFGVSPASMYLQFKSPGATTYAPRLLATGGSISLGYAEAGRSLSVLITGMEEIPPGSAYVPVMELVYQGDQPIPLAAAILGSGGKRAYLEADSTFQFGDANGDKAVNIGDGVYVVQYVFRGGPPPYPLQAGDANCDRAINVGDAVSIVNYIFRGGPAPGCQ